MHASFAKSLFTSTLIVCEITWAGGAAVGFCVFGARVGWAVVGAVVVGAFVLGTEVVGLAVGGVVVRHENPAPAMRLPPCTTLCLFTQRPLPQPPLEKAHSSRSSSVQPTCTIAQLSAESLSSVAEIIFVTSSMSSG